MLYLRTGLPGASKSLNTLKEICHDKHSQGREIYYNNIKLLMLDFDVCGSFSGWFYGVYYPQIEKKLLKPIQQRLLKIHAQGELATLETFTHLRHIYDAWLAEKGYITLWLYWVKRCYPKSAYEQLQFFLDSADKEHITVESLKQFNLDFRHFEEPALWFELPRNSIIIIDECQQTFPPRPVGAKVPRHCAEFETHRHKGWDIHLVTQDAKLMDNHVRRLTGCHVHYFNPFKSSRVTRYQADKVFDPEDYFQKKNTISSIIARDKNFYGLYWSADAHTHKLVIPKKLLYALPIPFLVIFLAWYLVSGSWSSNTQPAKSNQPMPGQITIPGQTQQILKPAYVLPDIKPHSLLSTDTPIGQLCDELIYSGFQLKKDKYGRYNSVHFFTCELPYNEKESKNEEDFIKPSLIVDGQYLNTLGFAFEFLNRMPILTYNGVQYIFPRY